MIDGDDFYIDLLFYHRKLRRLVAIDLKLEKFKAADKGQMELYLRWLEKHETEEGEGTPLGLILCADKGDEQVELLQLDKSGIRVATYLTELPPRRITAAVAVANSSCVHSHARPHFRRSHRYRPTDQQITRRAVGRSPRPRWESSRFHLDPKGANYV